MLEHFDSQGKHPSQATVAVRAAQRASLPFDDTRDFDEAHRGFLAAPGYRQITADAGHVAWDIGAYDFLLDGVDFDSIHPSLQRQAVLNMEYGLFEVIPDRVYQVRGFDLANISFIRSDTGWIIFDPLTCRETAAAALALVTEHLGERPVVAVVYSHSHVDHFGGGPRGRGRRRCQSGTGAGDRSGRVHAACRGRERVRGQRDEPAGVLPVRHAGAAQPVRARRPGDRQGCRLRLGRP